MSSRSCRSGLAGLAVRELLRLVVCVNVALSRFTEAGEEEEAAAASTRFFSERREINKIKLKKKQKNISSLCGFGLKCGSVQNQQLMFR